MALAGCGFLWAAGASAEGKGTVDFAWRAPEGCPAAEAVRAEIDKLLGGAAAAPPREELSVHASVTHGALWLVELDTLAGTTSGHRTIAAATCQGLANATALIVALMIDPEAVAAHRDEAKASAPSPAAASPEAPPGPAAPRTTLALAGIGAAGHLGVVPEPGVAVAAHIGFVHERWRAEVRAAYDLRVAHSDRLADPPDAYGSFRFYAATLTGCWAVPWRALALGPCADLELGLLHGEGIGATETTTRNAPWLALGAGGLVVATAASWLRFPLHVDATVPVWRPNFVFTNVPGRIFRPAALGARLTIGVEVQF